MTRSSTAGQARRCCSRPSSFRIAVQSGARVWMIIDGDRLATTFTPHFTALIEEQFHPVYTTGKTSVLLAEEWQELPEYTVVEEFDDPLAWPDLALVGWERSEAMAAKPLAVRLYWALRGEIDDDLHTSLQLIAEDGASVAQADGPISQGILSLGDIEEMPFPEFKLLNIPEVEPGLYRLDVVAYDIDDRDPIGPPISVGWFRIGDVEAQPMEVNGATWAAGLMLNGRSSLPDTLDADSTLGLDLAWTTSQSLGGDYTAFVHLVGPNGTVVAQRDQTPLNGFYPTSRWPITASGQSPINDLVVDRYEIQLPPTLEPGAYRLLVGWYDGTTGERLRTATGDDAIELGTWQLQ